MPTQEIESDFTVEEIQEAVSSARESNVSVVGVYLIANSPEIPYAREGWNQLLDQDPKGRSMAALIRRAGYEPEIIETVSKPRIEREVRNFESPTGWRAIEPATNTNVYSYYLGIRLSSESV